MKSDLRTGIVFRLVLAVALLTPGVASALQTETVPEGSQDPQEAVVQEPAPVPARKVDQRFAGWQGAGTGIDGSRVTDELRANWVAIDSQNSLRGTVLGEGGAFQVYLLRNGLVASNVTTDEGGNFVFDSVTPGPCSIVGYAAGRFFAYGFNAVEGGGAGTQLPLQIHSMPTAGNENFRLISKLISQYSTSVKFAPWPEYEAQQGLSDPPALFGFAGLKSFTGNPLPATSIQYHPVSILSDGRVLGRVHQLHGRSGRPIEIQGTLVKLLQEGEVVAEGQADSYGVFEFAGVSPGRYEFVAVGSDGFAALGLEVVESSSSAGAASTALNASFSRSGERWHQEPVVSQEAYFDCCLTDAESIGWVNSFVQEEAYRLSMSEPRVAMTQHYPPDMMQFGNQCGGCGCGAYGGFGGGGGFGLGGAGNWLLAGAIGIAIADSISSDTEFGNPIVIPPPVSPNN